MTNFIKIENFYLSQCYNTQKKCKIKTHGRTDRHNIKHRQVVNLKFNKDEISIGKIFFFAFFKSVLSFECNLN